MDHVTWGISTNRPMEPLIVFTVSTVLFIFDVSSQTLVGKLRGHGGVNILPTSNSPEIDKAYSLSHRCLFTPRCLTCSQLRPEISRPASTTSPYTRCRRRTTHIGFRAQSPVLQGLLMGCICVNQKVKV